MPFKQNILCTGKYILNNNPCVCAGCTGTINGDGTYHSVALDMDVPCTLVCKIYGGVPIFIEPPVQYACTDYSATNVTVLTLATDVTGVTKSISWSAQVCGATITYSMFEHPYLLDWSTQPPGFGNCGTGPMATGWVNRLTYFVPYHVDVTHDEVFFDVSNNPTIKLPPLTLGPHSESFFQLEFNNGSPPQALTPCGPDFPVEFGNRKYAAWYPLEYEVGQTFGCYLTTYTTGSYGECYVDWYGGFCTGEYNNLHTIQAQIIPWSLETWQSCCMHGPYCPDNTIEPENSGELLDGLCCVSVTVDGIEHGTKECYYGYPAAYIPPSYSLTTLYRHTGCGTWMAKQKGCINPYPTIFSIVADENQSTHVINGWVLSLLGDEAIMTEHYSYPASQTLIMTGYLPATGTCTSIGIYRPTKAEIEGVTMQVIPGYTPPNCGPDLTNATAHVNFAEWYTWGECDNNAAPPTLSGVWGWKLSYTDCHNVGKELTFTPTPNTMEWKNSLIDLTLIGDISSRPGACLLSLQYTYDKYGYYRGFCFEDDTLHEATCTLPEIVISDADRYIFMLGGFLPGTDLVLTPLYSQPNPITGSICNTTGWNLTWNNSIYTLAGSSGGPWTYNPSASESYALTRQANDIYGRGNYELDIDLSYPIIAISTGSKTFTIDNDKTGMFAVSSTFVVESGTNNSGTYTVNSINLSGGDTVIGTTESIPSGTPVDGNVAKHILVDFTTSSKIHCCDAGEINLTFNTNESAIIQANCVNQCEATAWDIVMTDCCGGYLSGSAQVIWYPSLCSWWYFGEDLTICIIRLKNSGTTTRYALTITYTYDLNTYYSNGIFEGGTDCCSAGVIDVTMSDCTSLTVEAVCG